MKTAIVTYSNGDSITTSVNGSDEEIQEYFAIGREFNIGIGPEDLIAHVIALEIDGVKMNPKS